VVKNLHVSVNNSNLAIFVASGNAQFVVRGDVTHLMRVNRVVV
jgi:hypothetical protein